VPPESNYRKILLVTNDLGPRSGGIETFIHGLLEKLDGSQIAILTSSQKGDTDFDKELSRKHGVVVYRYPAKVLLPTPRIIKRAKAIMREHNSTTIWFGAAAPLALMAGARTGAVALTVLIILVVVAAAAAALLAAALLIVVVLVVVVSATPPALVAAAAVATKRGILVVLVVVLLIIVVVVKYFLGDGACRTRTRRLGGRRAGRRL
jgi:hypothetical protein